jgi:hypothetical protein
MWKEQSTSYQDADKAITTDDQTNELSFRGTDNQNHHHHS